jgi:PII-like signaling protein
MESEVTIVRIYLHEADHGAHKNLMQEILNILQKMHEVRGVVVFRGIAGLDESGQVRASDLLRIVGDLPIVVEFFDTPAKVEAVLAALDGLIPSGRIVHWTALCR